MHRADPKSLVEGSRAADAVGFAKKLLTAAGFDPSMVKSQLERVTGDAGSKSEFEFGKIHKQAAYAGDTTWDQLWDVSLEVQGSGRVFWHVAGPGGEFDGSGRVSDRPATLGKKLGSALKKALQE